MKQVKSVCPYCGVGCGIVMQVEANRVIKISGDKQHPSNFGRLCTKGNSCHQPLADSGRLEQAFMRSDRSQEPVQVGIEEAIDTSAMRLRAIIDEHGPDAVALYVSGQMSLEAQYLANKLAKGFIGTNNIESNSRLCMASAGSGYKQSLGSDGPPGSYQDFDHASLFFVIGSNMADCHPILFLRMMDRVKAGAKLIVVDPRRTATAEKASLFLQIRPGSDLALLNGLLALLVKNNALDHDFIERFTEGWQAMPEFLADYTPEQVAERTGLAVADIQQAATWIGEAAEWMSCWTMGLNQSTHGTWNTNALCNLHLATGAICRRGSGPFSLTGQPNAMGGREMGYMGMGLPGQRSVLVAEDRQFVEQQWGVPAGTLRTDLVGGTVEMFRQMAAGSIKACWVICTNPVASAPNRQTVIDALQQAELVITQDAFLDTETNRYADILLPAALWAEAEGVMINSERNITLMPQAITPPGEALADWQIIARVACALGYSADFSYTSAEAVFDEIRAFANPHTGYDIRGVSYARLRTTPVQWPSPPEDRDDRHPLRYRQEDNGIRFATASGKAQFFARPDMPPAELPDDTFPLVLNTGRVQHQWHTLTKTGKVATLNKLNPGPFVEINPQDAQRLNIQPQDQLEIRSRRGSARLPAVITDRVLPGNCFAPFHWSDVFGEQLAVNAVTSDAIDPVSQQPEFKFSAVSVTRMPPSPVNPTAQRAQEPLMKPVDAFAALLGLETTPVMQLEADEKHYMQGFLAGLGSDHVQQALGVPVLPASAPLSHDKRLRVDGMLAGLFARIPLSDSVALPVASAPVADPVLILWASSTGNAEGLAAQCAQQLKQAGQTVKLAAMADVTPADLTATKRLLLIASTFGDGDAPDAATPFWQALQQDNAPRMEGVSYAVLALGDANYDRFCGFGKQLDARFAALGAQALAARVDCDADYQASATAWLQMIAARLEGEGASLEEKVVEKRVAGVGFSRNNPLAAHIVINRVLNQPGSAKETRQIAFDLQGHDFPYQAGDALGVWPRNCPDQVAALLQWLPESADHPVMLKEGDELPLSVVLERHVEIGRITLELLQMVAERSGDAALAQRLRPESRDALQQWLWGRNVCDVLQQFSLQIAAQDVVNVLRRMQPRLYSISSSPLVTPHQVHLTLSTVRYDKQRGGLCSTYLADRAGEEAVAIFVQKSAHFHPPANPAAPLIMVGPGTGIAPFRAFLQQRQASGASGRNWLIFGEQCAATDFYYQEELETFQREGYLQRLDTAFSRDQKEKVYVQQRMKEQGAELWRWLQDGAYFCVCGDASRMAKDVDAALRQIAQQHGGMSTAAAAEWVTRLAQEKRYLRDVY